MTKREAGEGARNGQEFEKRISRKQERRQKKLRSGHRHIWYGLGMFGLVGWSVAVPTLIFVAIGIWVDARFDTTYSWTLMGLAGGIATGCLNAWFWVSRESRA